jgi:hypothetical protein
METFIKLSEFFGGLILFFSFSWLIGHLLKLDKYIENKQIESREGNQVENN